MNMIKIAFVVCCAAFAAAEPEAEADAGLLYGGYGYGAGLGYAGLGYGAGLGYAGLGYGYAAPAAYGWSSVRRIWIWWSWLCWTWLCCSWLWLCCPCCLWLLYSWLCWSWLCWSWLLWQEVC